MNITEHLDDEQRTRAKEAYRSPGEIIDHLTQRAEQVEQEVVRLRGTVIAQAVVLVDVRHALRSAIATEWPVATMARCREAIDTVCPELCIECGTGDFASGRSETDEGTRCGQCAQVAALGSPLP